MRTLPKSNPKPSAKDDFSRECVEFFSEAVQVFGVPSSIGQIYGLLYSSPEPLSFSDIFDRLEISKGSASQGLKFLRALGAIHEVTPTTVSGRRDYFAPELSLRKLLRGILNDRVEPLARTSTHRLDRLRNLVDITDGRERVFRLNRVKQLETWRRRLRTIAPMLETVLGAHS